MLNSLLRFHKTQMMDIIIKLLLSVLLLVFLAPITLTVKGEMPITLQTLIILFVAISFGWQVGGLATLLYIALGLAGLPVFANYTGGFGHLNGIFGGFFFGFIIAAIGTGFLAELPQSKNPLVHFSIWVLGHAIILLLGAIWLRQFNPENWEGMIKLALPGAIIKSAFGFLFVQLLVRFFSKKQSPTFNP
jgi:biotin transport system substrate-specific component